MSMMSGSTNIIDDGLSFTDGKTVSCILGQINSMTKPQLLTALRLRALDCKGHKDVLKKRLKQFCRNQFKRNGIREAAHLAQSPEFKNDRFFDYFCVVDFECTCDLSCKNSYPHEIIEFPAILVEAKTLQVVDEFHSYCRPTRNATLSDFCSSLTGICQATVDSAKQFPLVFDDFQKWLESHQLGSKFRYAIVTDGPWDFGRFMQLQCLHSSIVIPHQFRYWVNLRRLFSNFYNVSRVSLVRMLAHIGFLFEGRQHSGIDDSRNIARLLCCMLKDGCEIRINQRLLRRDLYDQACSDQNGKKTQGVSNTFEERCYECRTNNDDASTSTGDNIPNNSIHTHEHIDLSKEIILPYVVLPVTKNAFLDCSYEDCISCDSDDEC